MDNQEISRRLRLLMVQQTLQEPTAPPGRTWAPMIEALHALAQEPPSAEDPPDLPLPLPPDPEPIERALGVPLLHWARLLSQAAATDDYRTLGVLSRAVLDHARLPANSCYQPVSDPPDLEPLYAAWEQMRNRADLEEFATIISNLNWSPDQLRLPLFPCGSLVHVAARSYGASSMEALERLGAAFDHRNHAGQLPADAAQEEGNAAALSWLASKGYHPTTAPAAPRSRVRPGRP